MKCSCFLCASKFPILCLYKKCNIILIMAWVWTSKDLYWYWSAQLKFGQLCQFMFYFYWLFLLLFPLLLHLLVCPFINFGFSRTCCTCATFSIATSDNTVLVPSLLTVVITHGWGLFLCSVSVGRSCVCQAVCCPVLLLFMLFFFFLWS